jgi:hypothetical protein
MSTDWSSTIPSKEQKSWRRRLWLGIVIGLIVAFALQWLTAFGLNHVNSRPGFMEREAYSEGRTVGLDESYQDSDCDDLAEARYELGYQGNGTPQTSVAFFHGCSDAKNDLGNNEDDPLRGGDD